MTATWMMSLFSLTFNIYPSSESPCLCPFKAAKSLQSCPTLCDPIDGSPPGSPIPGILQARTPEWVAISFSNAWKWKVKGKSLSRVRPSATPWIAAYQAPPPWDFTGRNTGVGCHCLLHLLKHININTVSLWCLSSLTKYSTPSPPYLPPLLPPLDLSPSIFSAYFLFLPLPAISLWNFIFPTALPSPRVVLKF